ncbi:hypothetical protein CSV61_11325 [Sporosarcina sp. P3]|uniref:MEDS domain-containing protein n=1 Tax=Sporosarcina sp. P3 TaxID=2048245 RepID=UPI000C16BFBA|nr:MEDS domain-containing protein [Sporosarcina sp. P3]PID21071.1 hypothetical protein CSV61_11325 [Sporosarcina sp. P3]
MNTTLQQSIERKRDLHILYSYKEIEDYIQTVATFIEDGIYAGEYTILIDNERIQLLVQHELRKRFSDEDMNYLHYINNFHFYYSTGSYHPATIEEYLLATLTPYVDQQLQFRLWAHVEWATIEGPLHVIRDVELSADKTVSKLSFPLICAYNEDRMPDHLKKLLVETHPFLLVNDELVLSELYEKNHTKM